jgi:hypothetical protein
LFSNISNQKLGGILKQFKIVPQRPGGTFKPRYADNVSQAIELAKEIGFSEKPQSKRGYIDFRPIRSVIYESTGADWEQVAVVTANGIDVVDGKTRDSYRKAEEEILRLKGLLWNIRQTAVSFEDWVQDFHERQLQS